MALPPQQFCVRWNSYHTNLQAVFPRLLLTEQFADVTLACESRQLRCHKLVLSACSAYLERLLLQNPCKHPIVLMRDMRFSEMQALVDFMYKGEVNVTQEELPSLLKSAEALQIRGLCSGEAGAGAGAEAEAEAGTRDFTLASDALLHAHRSEAYHQPHPPHPPRPPHQPSPKPGGGATNGPKKRKSEERERERERERDKAEVKEETVEEDGLYYGELDNEHLDYNEEEETGKPGSSLGQTSGRRGGPAAPRAPLLRVKPESELFFQNKLQNLEYMNRLSNMNAAEIQSEFSKYGLGDAAEEAPAPEDDFYKSWLEQNGELEVSLLRARGAERARAPAADGARGDKLARRRGRPPIFKDKNVDIGETVLKADLDQFLEGKEVSSSGLSRKDLERVMMGKFNPNRRYSNEAMWAALVDVKKGGSIYRAAQTHKVPRKSLRNWMKRCHIKSSFPMPQQLKQFVENSKRQREGGADAAERLHRFGEHFLSCGRASSDDERAPPAPAPAPAAPAALDMTLRE
ncbi:uncharacterized protein LOC112052375 isoform X1 [Bicyclus anynana]|uniref:Uncharacterized protein LOC112052375 isoform X1 n=1 Tax=Bicyclus anynana TaxID=110368 RepID=A0ABM3LJ26_BICAN|nr:uncharacterized protein LOC112052375 isoform X1 [Bicyclus anynana]XP_052739066.1 uncharacterized protein LOC112052375 isoform X1 [Bicyclus anynana]XP_052739068.1 uncharacterized protein LOC112052375 isoform X1 [Bicyclus anynana]XP_052739069.1 uncharacterized protein LOC112052375 isoform X1 [Bicyclus anynana]